MSQVGTVGLDLAKNVFRVPGSDAQVKVLVRRPLRRAEVLPFFAKLSPCLVGMEACGSARQLSKLGHTVTLMPPAYVRQYVKRGKTDAADAEAIAEARRGRPCPPPAGRSDACLRAWHRLARHWRRALGIAHGLHSGLLATLVGPWSTPGRILATDLAVVIQVRVERATGRNKPYVACREMQQVLRMALTPPMMRPLLQRHYGSISVAYSSGSASRCSVQCPRGAVEATESGRCGRGQQRGLDTPAQRRAHRARDAACGDGPSARGELRPFYNRRDQ